MRDRVQEPQSRRRRGEARPQSTFFWISASALTALACSTSTEVAAMPDDDTVGSDVATADVGPSVEADAAPTDDVGAAPTGPCDPFVHPV